MNTIQAAKDVFNAIKSPLKDKGFDIYFLSSHIVPIERLRRIESIKNSKNKKVIVSTQLVEAGIDIDLERVIRDFAPFDSITQVAGRSNRNLKRESGDVEIIFLKDESTGRSFCSYIYDYVLIDNTKRLLQSGSKIYENEFLNLSTQYFQEVVKTISDDISREFVDAIKMLKYEKIAEFELIKEKSEKVDIFVELDDEATEVWEQYQELMKLNDHRVKKQRFIKIREKFYRYVISVLATSAIKNLPPEVFGIKFISNLNIRSNEFYDIETGFKTESDTIIW